jgi:hypothetical protein
MVPFIRLVYRNNAGLFPKNSAACSIGFLSIGTKANDVENGCQYMNYPVQVLHWYSSSVPHAYAAHGKLFRPKICYVVACSCITKFVGALPNGVTKLFCHYYSSTY